MKIAVKPAVTSSAEGSRPSSSRLRGLSMRPSLPVRTARALRSGVASLPASGRRSGRAPPAAQTMSCCLADIRWMTSDHPRRGWSMLKRFLLGGAADRGAQRRRDRDGRAEHRRRARQSGLPQRQPHRARRKRRRRPNTTAGRRPSWSSAPTGANGSKDAYDREDPPHSDTILLVRFDPEQGQTSVLSIPRDLMVNITTPNGQVYADEKINAAYTVGTKLGGTKGAIVLAAETIEHEVFPGLHLNGIIDVSFAGFIKVVDTLGCAYVNVDHRYYNENVGTDRNRLHEHQPAARLPEALLRKRARLRSLPAHRLGLRARRTPAGLPARPARADHHPKTRSARSTRSPRPSAHAITRTFRASASELIELAKLIAFSQTKPLRQVRFQTRNVTAPCSERRLLCHLRPGARGADPRRTSCTATKSWRCRAPSARARSQPPQPVGTRSGERPGLCPDRPRPARAKRVKAAFNVPFRVLYPAVQTGAANSSRCAPTRSTTSRAHLHHAYVVVWQQNEHRRLLRLRGHRLAEPAAVRPCADSE